VERNLDHDFWDKALGTKEKPNYVGDGWYAVDVVVPSAPRKKVWLQLAQWTRTTHCGSTVSTSAITWLRAQRCGISRSAWR